MRRKSHQGGLNYRFSIFILETLTNYKNQDKVSNNLAQYAINNQALEVYNVSTFSS